MTYNKECMVEIRIRDLVGIIAIFLLFSLIFTCFVQREHISYLKRAIEQRDSLIYELIYKPQN